MNPLVLVAIVVIVVLLAVIGWLVAERRRSDDLKARFGPEYQRTVETEGDRRSAEAELQRRIGHVNALHIRPLPEDQRDEYADEWRHVQADFVDQPSEAITEADRLVGQVMEARGYPVGDFEQRVADVSVDHPDVVEHYRKAHAIHSERRASTEDLRQAMVHYRALFADLLEPPAREQETNRSERIEEVR
jgi:hypothetical protein